MIIRLKSIFNPLPVTERSVEDFHAYYNETHAFIRSVIYWMVRNQAVDDLVQETYLRAWKSFSGFDGESSFKTWVYRIAKNVTYDFLKSSKKFEEASYEQLEQISGQSSDPELEDLITKGLLSLNADHRECLVLFYKLGYTVSEIAVLTKLPEGTVKSRLHYAKDRFSKFLEKNGVRNE
ncbi:MAG: hypothetical protein CME71_09350 [Halobacteriovorax sp.]|nr:hypothetical protein [Halobacteriovorax sp.]|tara:strand:- start:815 stop:1351 length:537 start_codon:yes stop_codon:yes gene_type:complete